LIASKPTNADMGTFNKICRRGMTPLERPKLGVHRGGGTSLPATVRI